MHITFSERPQLESDWADYILSFGNDRALAEKILKILDSKDTSQTAQEAGEHLGIPATMQAQSLNAPAKFLTTNIGRAVDRVLRAEALFRKNAGAIIASFVERPKPKIAPNIDITVSNEGLFPKAEIDSLVDTVRRGRPVTREVVDQTRLRLQNKVAQWWTP